MGTCLQSLWFNVKMLMIIKNEISAFADTVSIMEIYEIYGLYFLGINKPKLKKSRKQKLSRERWDS